MAEQPKVSVIIPTYNRNRKLMRAVRSIKSQTYENIQLIIVNDSQENEIPENIINSSGIISTSNKHRAGAAGARNTGIELAKGKYIAFLDDDDFFHRKKIEKQVRAMVDSEDSDYFGCITGHIYFDSEDDLEKENGKIIRENTSQVLYRLLRGNKIRIGGSSSLLVEKNSLKDVKGFDERFSQHQDWELLIRLLRNGKLMILKEPLFTKVGHTDPNLAELRDSKKLYLNKYRDEINSFSDIHKRRIFLDNYLKLTIEFLRNRKYLEGLTFFAKSIKSLKNT